MPETTHNLRNAYRSGHNKITVTENNGGMTYQFPKEISDKYQDMYLEMDVEQRSKVPLNLLGWTINGKYCFYL